MIDYLDYCIKCATKGVIFDTNVLLVFLIGLWDAKVISKFNRTSSYTEDDFELLLLIANKVGRIVITPHILTEACNLSDTLNKKHGYRIYEVITMMLKDTKERRQEAIRLTADPLFNYLGIADMSLIDASKRHHLIVTDDLMCATTINDSGGLAININNLRGTDWLGYR